MEALYVSAINWDRTVTLALAAHERLRLKLEPQLAVSFKDTFKKKNGPHALVTLGNLIGLLQLDST